MSDEGSLRERFAIEREATMPVYLSEADVQHVIQVLGNDVRITHSRRSYDVRQLLYAYVAKYVVNDTNSTASPGISPDS